MAIIRFKAIEKTMDRKPVDVAFPADKTSEYFGVSVFDKKKMEKYLSKQAFRSVIKSMEDGSRIDRKIVDEIAAGFKAWALDNGATHYTHWFHPLTETTAEKHDAFIDYTSLGVLENFEGKQLVQQEPDASSFPSGGIRATFEARGYTAWDPTSPAFILNNTLIIPTIFISYTGESLDYKTPLIKALAAVDKAAVDVCQYFDHSVNKVNACLGWEQEYFLVDEALYWARPDLILTGRTLLGHASAKDQQLEDQYFATTPERVANFMREVEIESYKLGIPAKTRHNEVAPNQYELAPIYEEANLAVDHNMLVMDIMRKVARKHNFYVLLHEKPFAGINGSGKHSNWSLNSNVGSLYSPGHTPRANLQFLTFIIVTVKAVHEHADLLRASIASSGNEHRLGANEAPPSIISVFLGTQLSKMLDEIEAKLSNGKVNPSVKKELKLDIGNIPQILLDNTDRNRTSPFAFTGNRFEFRAVGSAANCASAMIALNTIVADQLNKFKLQVDALIDEGIKKDDAILEILRKYIIESKAIRFDGNNYSEEWKKEAKKRGLTNIASCPEALKAYLSSKSKKVFTKYNILSERELEARYEVSLENYIKKIQIESRVLGDLAVNHVVPTAHKYQKMLAESCQSIQSIYDEKNFQLIAAPALDTLKLISEQIADIKKNAALMTEARKKINQIDQTDKRAIEYSTTIRTLMDAIRKKADILESLVDDELWPLPKYRELLFIR